MSELDAVRKIGEVIVGAGGQASIAFSSIDQRYRSLQIIAQMRGDTVATTTAHHLQFNGDTAANYDYTEVFNAAGAGGLTSYAQTSAAMGSIVAASAPANAASSASIIIPNYAGTVFHKSLQGTVENIRDTSTLYAIETYGARWRSTAAITSILLFPASGNFASGSVVSLYALT